MQYKALQCFEGMKAYKPLLSSSSSTNTDQQLPTKTNEIRLFRPEKNMERLSGSMKRLGMPGYNFPHQELIHCIAQLVRLDESFIPTSTTPGYALYIRPTVIATHPFLGLCPPEQLLLYVICSPVGPYYKSARFAPIKLIASSVDQIRAWPGGTGYSKIGANYAGTMLAQQYALQKGYEQVLWLLDDTITEVGSMNVFFVINDPNDINKVLLITPPLSRGDILPGVTRDSVMQLAQTEWSNDVTVIERDITMSEVIDLIQTHQLREVFGTGTAAVVTAIQSIQHQGIEYIIPSSLSHETSLTQRIWDTLTGIQYGTREGPKGWSVLI
jgi:branched-chain amino acid aminotransferase